MPHFVTAPLHLAIFTLFVPMIPVGYAKMIHYTVGRLLSKPNEAGLHWQEDQPGRFSCIVTISADDVGSVLGKHGHTISALRAIIKLSANHHNHHVRLTIQTNDDPPRRIV